MPIRWRCPPENSCGKRCACSGARPTSDSSSAIRALARGAGMQAVRGHRLVERVADAPARIQARVRILEDDLQPASVRPHRARRQRREIGAFESHFAGGRLDQLQHRAADRALARTRFADEAQHFAFSISKLTSSTARTGRSPWPKYFLRPRTASIASLHSIAQRRQRERWPASRSASGGIAAAHSGNASAQRGANAQPGSGSSGLATWPGIAFSRRVPPDAPPRRPARAAAGRPAARACTDASAP